MKAMRSWGRLSNDPHEVVRLDRPDAVPGLLRSHPNGIAFGNGRSYGDICLNPRSTLWHTVGLDHLIAWDPVAGLLVCEAGVLLRDIQRVLVPQGWMLPVTPGTQLVTVGGAIANDVHGKNHHCLGSFGDHVNRLWLARTDGQVFECGPDLRPNWFAATVGGMGLTGVVVKAELRLRQIAGPWLDTETMTYDNLESFFSLSDESEQDWEQTVSWVDCLAGESARGVFMRANPSAARAGPSRPQRERMMPLTPPISLVNRLSLKAFNSLYFQRNRYKVGKALVHHEPFSYPLDQLHEWNRMYGPKGFYQYQSVVPRAIGLDATRAMLREIARSGQGSFLAVLKTFGDRAAPGMLSFPRHGVTLALDFPNRGDSTLRLFERLDHIVREAGGAIYPAKDARMSRDMFEVGYPRLPEFLPYRDRSISSAMSRRLLGS